MPRACVSLVGRYTQKVRLSSNSVLSDTQPAGQLRYATPLKGPDARELAWGAGFAAKRPGARGRGRRRARAATGGPKCCPAAAGGRRNFEAPPPARRGPARIWNNSRAARLERASTAPQMRRVQGCVRARARREERAARAGACRGRQFGGTLAAKIVHRPGPCARRAPGAVGPAGRPRVARMRARRRARRRGAKARAPPRGAAPSRAPPNLRAAGPGGQVGRCYC